MLTMWGIDNFTTDQIAAWTPRGLAVLQRDGIIPLPWHFTKRQVLHLTQYLKGCDVWNAHVRAKATEPPVTMAAAQAERRWQMMSHSMDDVVRAPYLFEFSVLLHDFATRYFDGEFARLYSMNIIWTQRAGGAPYADTHSWHRDGDDRKQLVLFTFLTEVGTPEHGMHLYQKGTHKRGDNDLGRDFRQPGPDDVQYIGGEAGMMFLADTRGLHMGLRPDDRRGLAWARWGVSDPPDSYNWDQLSPVALDPTQRALLGDDVLREAVKLVAV